MANQFLGLSLFVMLLSFFIILNANSNFEEIKSKPVLNSLAVTFADRKVEQPPKPNVTQSTVQATSEGDTLDKLQALFNTHITDVEAKQNRLGTIMHIRMPVSKFERAVSAPALAANGMREGFLPTLVSLMETRETEIPYRMDIVLNTPSTPASMVSRNTATLKKNTRQVALFSNSLERSGLDKKLMSVGLAKGKPGFVEIYFQRYEPFNPLGEEL